MVSGMESAFQRLQSIAGEAWLQAYSKSIDILPEVVLAIVIIGVGLIISTGIYYLAVRIMAFFAIDKLAGKTPLQQFMRNVGIHRNISNIVALLFFWLGVLITLIFAADVLELEQVSNALGVVTRFIPQVIAALLMVIFGMLLAKFLQVFVEQALAKVQERMAIILGRIVYIAVLLFVLNVVVEQLGFDLSFITTNVVIVLCAIFIVFSIGAIVAARTLLENIFSCYQLRQEVRIGDRVSVAGKSGRVRRFTLTGVVLESEGGDAILPALVFFQQTYSLTRNHAS